MLDNTPCDSSSRSFGIRAVLPEREELEKTATSGARGRSGENKMARGTAPMHSTSLQTLARWRKRRTSREVWQPAQFQPTTHPAAACCRNRRSEQLQKTSPWAPPRRSYTSHKKYFCKSYFLQLSPGSRDQARPGSPVRAPVAGSR